MKVRIFTIIAGLILSHASFAIPLSPLEVLKKADEIRNPGENYSMKVEVLSGDQKSTFEVSIQGNQKTLIKTMAPTRDRGRNMLMLGEEMWAFIPNLNRAVRVGLAQKLTGQASNGDISRMRWSGDYTATVESETPTEWVLFLTATKKGLTYEKIRVWIQKDTFYPLKAEFLTLSGNTLKKASYENYHALAGRIRPSRIRIQDAVRADQVSLIEIQEMTVRNFPESLFNQNALK